MCSDRGAREQTATADRGDDRVDRAAIAEQFQRRRALAGDYARVERLGLLDPP